MMREFWILQKWEPTEQVWFDWDKAFSSRDEAIAILKEYHERTKSYGGDEFFRLVNEFSLKGESQ